MAACREFSKARSSHHASPAPLYSADSILERCGNIGSIAASFSWRRKCQNRTLNVPGLSTSRKRQASKPNYRERRAHFHQRVGGESTLWVGLSGKKAQLSGGAGIPSQALQGDKYVTRQLSMLVWPVVAATLHTLDRSRTDKLQKQRTRIRLCHTLKVNLQHKGYIQLWMGKLGPSFKGRVLFWWDIWIAGLFQGREAKEKDLQVDEGVGEGVQIWPLGRCIIHQDLFYNLHLLQPAAAEKHTILLPITIPCSSPD